jgi:hypothetical protein
MFKNQSNIKPEETYIEISYNIWLERYEPLTQENSDEVRMFETYGDDIKFLEKQDPNTIWTLIDEEENMHIVSGIRFVNRLGYYVTKHARNPLDFIVVVD